MAQRQQRPDRFKSFPRYVKVPGPGTDKGSSGTEPPTFGLACSLPLWAWLSNAQDDCPLSLTLYCPGPAPTPRCLLGVLHHLASPTLGILGGTFHGVERDWGYLNARLQASTQLPSYWGIISHPCSVWLQISVSLTQSWSEDMFGGS